MPFKHISPVFSVSGQLTLDDVRDAATQGFKTIICNRPDNEEPAQLDSSIVQEQSEALGMKFAYIPVSSSGVTPSDGVKMRAALYAMPSPVLAYCRSGARSGKVFELAQQAYDKPSDSKTYDVVIVGGGIVVGIGEGCSSKCGGCGVWGKLNIKILLTCLLENGKLY